MADADRLPAKKDVARALLLKGTVFVHLDPRVPGVSVPRWLSDQPQLVLQVGLDMPVPIPDLRVDEAGISGTLSFSRTPFLCVVPWSAVFAVVGDDGRGMVWPTSMPDEIAAEVAREARRAGRPDLDEAVGRQVRQAIRDRDEQHEQREDRRRARKPSAARSQRVATVAPVREASPAGGPPAKRASELEPRPSIHPPLGLIHGEGASRSSALRPRASRKRSRPAYLRVVK